MPSYHILSCSGDIFSGGLSILLLASRVQDFFIRLGRQIRIARPNTINFLIGIVESPPLGLLDIPDLTSAGLPKSITVKRPISGLSFGPILELIIRLLGLAVYTFDF
jgi:hypothetical protein